MVGGLTGEESSALNACQHVDSASFSVGVDLHDEVERIWTEPACATLSPAELEACLSWLEFLSVP